jgi:CDP-glycerol glycerophosphotransferase
MKISVVIPAYNAGKWLAQCIENILCQTYKDLEIIVIDDGSSDDTASIAAQYSAVKLIRQENQGAAAARNTGIAAATGDYIHFMDADDLIGLNYYTLMAEAISLTNADMAYGELINEAKIHAAFRFPDCLLLSTTEDKVVVTGVIQAPSCWRYLIKKSFLYQNKLFFEAGRIIEDVLFSLEAVYAAKNIVTVPGAIYYYKRRDGSVLTRRDKAYVCRRKESERQAKAFLKAFLQKHDLNGSVVAHRVIKHNILGFISVFQTSYSNGVTKWRIGGRRRGLCLLRTRGQRL